MNKSKKNLHGFTLIELIVVLMILGILAAMVVPSFTGYIDKQKEKSAIEECRNVVAAAQSLYNDQIAKNNPDSIQDKVSYDETLELAGVNGKITKIAAVSTLYDSSKEGSSEVLPASEYYFQIKGLTYTAENGLHVKYEANADPKYVITDDSVYTPLEEYIKDYQQTISQLIDDGKITNLNGQRYEYAQEYLKITGGTYLQVESVFLGEQNKGKELYWQPYYIANGKQGPKGSTSTLLFATPRNGTEAKDTHNQWKAYLVYFQGQVYQSTADPDYYKNRFSSVSGLRTCKSDQDVLDWLNNPENKFKPLNN